MVWPRILGFLIGLTFLLVGGFVVSSIAISVLTPMTVLATRRRSGPGRRSSAGRLAAEETQPPNVHESGEEEFLGVGTSGI